MRQKKRKSHGYIWEFFKECIELEFIPKNSHYVLRCKFGDLVNTTKNNLRQYIKVYTKLMLEVRHMHELN